MILRPLPHSSESAPHAPDIPPAAKVFMELQRHAKPPCAIIFQAEHSTLAGDLAEALWESTFGGLPSEVIQAIEQHDSGWNASDQAQLQSIGQINPRPFPCLSAEETLPSWRESLAHARTVSALVDVLVSRHFCLLGAGDPAHANFVREENERRSRIEPELLYPAADLNRWTAALGFCDLLSLYLCCGSERSVEFPLAHPAAPNAADAPKTTLTFHNRQPQFSSPVLRSGTHLSLTARQYDGRSTQLTPLPLKWYFDKT